jgi:hypothetical protein
MAVNRLLQETLSKSGLNSTVKTDVTRRLSPLQNFFLFDFIPASARLFGIWTKVYPSASQAVSRAGKRMSRNCELTQPGRSFLVVCIKLRCSDLVDQLDLNGLLRGVQRELRLIKGRRAELLLRVIRSPIAFFGDPYEIPVELPVVVFVVAHRDRIDYLRKIAENYARNIRQSLLSKTPVLFANHPKHERATVGGVMG